MRIPEEFKALHERAGWIQRGDTGRLWVRGQDRRSYLHGLLTNDVEGLSAGQACYAALLTPQGRMITDMRVFERGDAVLMTLPRPLTTPVLERLDQFVFSEDVRFEDATASTVQFGLYGPSADTIVRDISAQLLAAVVPSDDFGVHGFELVAAVDATDAIVDAFTAAGATRVSEETLDASRIEAGIPRFLVDMREDTIPLEAGIEDRAISLTKGCYVGQEIIIRVLHRGGGRVARRLVRIALPAGSAVPAAGAGIVSTGDGERSIGSVTSSAQSPSLGRPLALGYVHRDYTEPGTIVGIATETGATVTGEVLGR